MKTKSAVLAILLTISSGFVRGQLSQDVVEEIKESKNVSKLLKRSSTLTKDEYLYYAEILADRMLELEPENTNFHFSKGFLMLEMRKDYIGAIPHLEKAVTNVSRKCDMYSHKETKSPTDAYFQLAQCYHLNEEVDKAITYFKKFQKVSATDSELLPLSDLYLKQCAEAKRLMAAPSDVKLRNLENPINTNANEYSSVVSMDGAALYFTSRRAWPNDESESYRNQSNNLLPEDVYVSFMGQDSTWEPPVKLDFCKPERNEASISVNSHERKIHLYSDDGGGDIYSTDFYHAKFQDIKKVDLEHVNSVNWENHCMMSPDQKYFFFVSDRPGGFGGSDIYMIERTANGQWSAPKNLGAGVNTAYDEDAPFIATDSKTLYYSSNGEKSMGEFDLFKSELRENGSWSEGVNMGYPFNSTNVDTYYSVTLDGSRGYITSCRKNPQGVLDIYEVYTDEHQNQADQVTILKGQIKTIGGKPIPEDFAMNTTLTCLDCEEEDVRHIFPRLKDGIFMAALQPGKTYKLEYKNLVDDVVMQEEVFTTRLNPKKQETVLEALMDVDARKIVDGSIDYKLTEEKDLSVLRGKVNTVDNKSLPENLMVQIDEVCPNCPEPESYQIHPNTDDGTYKAELSAGKTYNVSYINGKDGSVLRKDAFTAPLSEKQQETALEALMDTDAQEIVDGSVDYVDSKDKKLSVLEGKINSIENKPLPEDLIVEINEICSNCPNAESYQIQPNTHDGTYNAELTAGKTYNAKYITSSDGKVLREEPFTAPLSSKQQKTVLEALMDTEANNIVKGSVKHKSNRAKDISVMKGTIRSLDNKPLPEDLVVQIEEVCFNCAEPEFYQIHPNPKDGTYKAELTPGKTYDAKYVTTSDGMVLREETFTTRLNPARSDMEFSALIDVDKKTVVDSKKDYTDNFQPGNSPGTGGAKNGTTTTTTKDIDLKSVTVAPSKNLEFMHYFGYNKNKLSVYRGKLNKFIKQIEDQLERGRENISINIYSSASKVPTKTYSSNQNLTEIRAENMKYDLINYFENKPEFKGKVNIVIVTTIIQGPEYEEDAGNLEKYKPYQYVGLKTE